MCGLSGFAGISSIEKRLVLSKHLGTGIDARGGHAFGYVTVQEGRHKLAKRIGTFKDASARFRFQAALGDVCMMHSRYATCGSRDNVEHAHPFTIKRDGKTVLYGAHNGVLGGTYTSAKKHGRTHTVDSRELLELLADNKLDEINKLDGYGVITYMRPGSADINVARLANSSEFIAVAIKGGGMAYASTWKILDTALQAADLEAEHTLETPNVGHVYVLRADAFQEYKSTLKVEEEYRDWRSGITSYGGASSSYAWKGWEDDDEAYYSQTLKDWAASKGLYSTTYTPRVSDSDAFDLARTVSAGTTVYKSDGTKLTDEAPATPRTIGAASFDRTSNMISAAEHKRRREAARDQLSYKRGIAKGKINDALKGKVFISQNLSVWAKQPDNHWKRVSTKPDGMSDNDRMDVLIAAMCDEAMLPVEYITDEALDMLDAAACDLREKDEVSRDALVSSGVRIADDIAAEEAEAEVAAWRRLLSTGTSDAEGEE